MSNGDEKNNQEVIDVEAIEPTETHDTPETTPEIEEQPCAGVSRRNFLKGLGTGIAVGAAGTLGIQYAACREEKPEEIAAFEIPFDNWLSVVGGVEDYELMSRCNNFDLGAVLLYLEDNEDATHPRMDYKEKNKLIEREEAIGIHREKPQMTKGGKRGYVLRVVGIDGGKKGTKKYIDKVLGRYMRISSQKAERYAASPVVDVVDKQAGLYRDTLITANVDTIDFNDSRSEADLFK
jgi:hypothetical protein